jgi:hypothetical protein
VPFRHDYRALFCALSAEAQGGLTTCEFFPEYWESEPILRLRRTMLRLLQDLLADLRPLEHPWPLWVSRTLTVTRHHGEPPKLCVVGAPEGLLPYGLLSEEDAQLWAAAEDAEYW